LADFKAKLETVEARRDRLQLPTVEEESGNDNDGMSFEADARPQSGSSGARDRASGKPFERTEFSASAGKKGDDRANAEVATLYEQDLSGFEAIGNPELEAFEREQFLTAFAVALHNETGGECTVPIWARAHMEEVRSTTSVGAATSERGTPHSDTHTVARPYS
jgi:hypothetical protein